MSQSLNNPHPINLPQSGFLYNDEWIATPHRRLTQAEQMQLLDWHPIFLGRCPHCETPIATPDDAQSHWNCHYCDWTLARLADHIDLSLS
jgi:hypothetical protein